MKLPTAEGMLSPVGNYIPIYLNGIYNICLPVYIQLAEENTHSPLYYNLLIFRVNLHLYISSYITLCKCVRLIYHFTLALMNKSFIYFGLMLINYIKYIKNILY